MLLAEALYRRASTDPLASADETTREFSRSGASLYLNGHALKIQADWTIRFGDGSTRPTNLFRLQLDATF